MKDPRLVLAALGTLAISACAVILAWRGDVTHMMTLAALLVPSAAQLGAVPASGSAPPPPSAVKVAP